MPEGALLCFSTYRQSLLATPPHLTFGSCLRLIGQTRVLASDITAPYDITVETWDAQTVRMGRVLGPPRSRFSIAAIRNLFCVRNS